MKIKFHLLYTSVIILLFVIFYVYQQNNSDTESLFKDNSNTVVSIYEKNANQEKKNLVVWSGVFVDQNGTVLTSAHPLVFLGDCTTTSTFIIKYTSQDKKNEEFEYTVDSMDQETDTAIMKPKNEKPKDISYLNYEANYQFNEGEEIFVITSFYRRNINEEKVSHIKCIYSGRITSRLENSSVFGVDINFSNSMSGGAVFSKKHGNKLLGIVRGESKQDINFDYPVEIELKNSEKLRIPYIASIQRNGIIQNIRELPK